MSAGDKADRDIVLLEQVELLDYQIYVWLRLLIGVE